MQNRTRLTVFFCADDPTSYNKTRFFKVHHVLQRALLRQESGIFLSLTIDSSESFSSWSKVMKCPKPGMLLDCIILVLNQDRSLVLQAKILLD